MLKNLTDKFEIHAYGQAQVKNAEKLCELLNRWIEVHDIKSGYMFGDTYMIVIFCRAQGIFEAYRRAKEKAQGIAEKQSLLRNMARQGNALSPKRGQVVHESDNEEDSCFTYN